MTNGIIRGPGTGKTKELIEFAEKQHAIIICENTERILAKIHGYGKTGIEVISFYDYLTHKPDFTKTYCIDDLGRLTKLLNITAFTFTKES